MLDENVQNLIDRAAISDLVYAYANGLDRHDWQLYRSIFTDQIEMDFRSVGMKVGFFHADDWVRDAQNLFIGFKATQHTSTNHVHTIEGDRATCVSNMQAEHFVVLPDTKPEQIDSWTIGGYYVNELVRTANGWKIDKITLKVTWQRGNNQVSKLAYRRGKKIRGV